MTKPGSKRIYLTFGDSLAYGHLREVCYTLRNGGLCILPSDTCYALAGIPTRQDVIGRIAKILPEKEHEPISLSFGSLQMVEDWVVLTANDYRTIDKFCPGPITVVCVIKETRDKIAISDLLHTSGTIGVRIPDSPVERQISIELGNPITTCAIRSDNNDIVRSYDDAIDIVRSRLSNLNENILLAAIQMKRIKYRDLSTVVSVQPSMASPYTIHVFRPGVIEPEEITDAIRSLSFWDVEDMT
jgi:tRNA threonylcarbamoyl adenosine modification protein (Sua5/YciO/YrdC/YwlC family)